MKKQSNPWEENLGKRLQNMQGTPAFDAWDRIEAELEKKPRRPWLLIAAAIALLLAPAGFWMWQNQDDLHPTAVPGLAEKTTTLENNEFNEVAEKSTTKTPDSQNRVSSGSVAGLAEEKPASEHIKAAKNKLSPAENKGEAVVIADNSNVPQTTNAHKKQSNKATIARHQEEISTQPNNGILPERDAIAATAAAAPASAADVSISTDIGKEIINNEDPNGKIASIISETEAAPEATSPLLKNKHLLTVAAIVPKADPLLFHIEAPGIETAVVQTVVTAETPPVISKDKNNRNRVSLWVKAQPTLSYSHVEPSKSDGIIITSLAPEPAISSSRLGGQLAAGVSYPLMKSLNWKSGAYYWYQQQNLSYTYHNARPDSYIAEFANSNALSYTARHFEHSQTIEKVYHNVGLSTGLSYQLPTRFVNSFLDTEAMLHYNSEQQINTFVSVGYLIKARLAGHTAFTMGPAVQLQLNNNQSISPHFDERPLIIGLQMGLLLNEK
ncbi:hypothetical protein D770_26525 [Flammeovirgaceae bacterium 311]|nr:hypothetical protein D770_26525 [Flammeovirgaceae bacterium 311]